MILGKFRRTLELAPPVALLMATILAIPASATVGGWARNHSAPTSSYHCNNYLWQPSPPGIAAVLEVCVVVSGHTWQPVAVFRNYTMDSPDITDPVYLYWATSDEPGVWHLAGDCGAANNVAINEWTMCFGSSAIDPSTTVQAKVTSFDATDANSVTFSVTPGYSPSVITGP